MKHCPECDTTKPLGDFYLDTTKGWYSRRCKACTIAAADRWRRANPEKVARSQRNSALRRNYGLTENDLNGMLASQRQRCKICCVTITIKSLVVDHDHETGKLRGLLCSQCNRGLGLLKDDPAVIRSAIRYLTRRKEIPDALF